MLGLLLALRVGLLIRGMRAVVSKIIFYGNGFWKVNIKVANYESWSDCEVDDKI